MRRASMLPPADGRMDQMLLPSDESMSPLGGGRRRSMLPPMGGLSISSLLTTRRMMRKPLVSRNSNGNIMNQVPLQPTYRMEPTTMFVTSEVHKILKDVLDRHLDGFQYNPKFCQTLTTLLSDDIKDQVKQLNFGRYKVVVSIILGERKEQGVIVCSRCAWDTKTDTFSTYTYKNPTMFCTGSVYGIYLE